MVVGVLFFFVGFYVIIKYGGLLWFIVLDLFGVYLLMVVFGGVLVGVIKLFFSEFFEVEFDDLCCVVDNVEMV